MSTTLLINGKLLDLNKQILSPISILINNNIIEVVSNKEIKADKKMNIIDIKGKTLMPGLIDAHIHVASPSINLMTDKYPETFIGIQAEKHLEKILARGFTSIRDAGGELYGIAEAVKAGLFQSPRLFYSGRAISQTGGHGDFRHANAPFMPCGCCNSGSVLSRIADGITEVRKAVRDEFRKGATQIKIMASGGVASPNDSIWDLQYSAEELAAIVEEAHAKHSYVMAHVFSPEGIVRCINAGIRSIEHGFMLDKPTAKLMRKKGVYLVPTLTITEVFEHRGKEFGVSESNIEKLRSIKVAIIESLKHAQAHKVKMGFGSDVFGNVIDEQSREFLLRSQYQNPAEVIRSATEINAELMQQKGKIGVIAEGAFADIIAVDGNPLKNIALLAGQGESIDLIMKDGKIYKNTL